MKNISKLFKKSRGCWVWLNIGPSGYGRFRGIGAHRVVYEMYKGQIPDGLVLDHLCGRKNCVNPKHLEPVTQQENASRRDKMRLRFGRVCKRSHDLPSAGSKCKKCVKLLKNRGRSRNIKWGLAFNSYGQKLTNRVYIRFSNREVKLIENKANDLGLPFSTYVRWVACKGFRKDS